MIDFAQIMMDWGRMCKDRNCGACNLEGICNTDPESRTYKEIVKIENVVTKWVAEHPEPVYPTWKEWLEKMGIMTDIHDKLNFKQVIEVCGMPLYSIPTEKVFCQIPADTAQKLGIEPKGEA